MTDEAAEQAPPAGATSVSEALSARLAGARGLAQTLGEGGGTNSMMAAIGGPRGLLESVIPVTVFSALYGITRDLQTSVVAALVPAVVLTLWRLAAREPLTQAVGGLVGIGIGAFVATRTGRAEDFFLPSLLKNLFFAALYGVSALVRWPLIGLLLGFFFGEGLAWRDVPARRRVYTQMTWLWSGMFGVRVAVQIPLYLAGLTAVLGGVNVALGLPLFAVTIWLSWLLLRRVPPVHVEDDDVVGVDEVTGMDDGAATGDAKG